MCKHSEHRPKGLAKEPSGPGFLMGCAIVIGSAFKVAAFVLIGLLVILFGFVRAVVAGLSVGVKGQ